ncbi:hypothetical protein GCM10028856_32300 [Halopiger thermotolerans]
MALDERAKIESRFVPLGRERVRNLSRFRQRHAIDEPLRIREDAVPLDGGEKIQFEMRISDA